MKKIILSENQAEKLISNVIGEQVPATCALEYTMNDGRYYQKCEFDFDYDTNDYLVYKGGNIEEIDYAYGNVSFQIEIQHETYGIKGIRIHDIRGPKEIKTKIAYYPAGVKYEDEDSYEKKIKEEVIIPLNWRNFEIDDEGGTYNDMNYFGIHKRIDVKLDPDGKGGLEGGRMKIIVNDLKISKD